MVKPPTNLNEWAAGNYGAKVKIADYADCHELAFALGQAVGAMVASARYAQELVARSDEAIAVWEVCCIEDQEPAAVIRRGDTMVRILRAELEDRSRG